MYHPLNLLFTVESMLTTCHHHVREEEKHSDGEVSVNKTLSESLNPNKSTLSERIDSAWTGTNQPEAQLHSSHADELIRKGLPPSSLHLSTLRSSHTSRDYRSMVRDPFPM